MIVVADTSPLNYLILIQHINLLPELYQSIIIPPAVREEMLHPDAPIRVRAWVAQPPSWLSVQIPRASPTTLDPKLGAGEREQSPWRLKSSPHCSSWTRSGAGWKPKN